MSQVPRDGVVYRLSRGALGRMPTLNLGAKYSAVAPRAFALPLAPVAPHSKNKPVAINPHSPNLILQSDTVCYFWADFCRNVRKQKCEIANVYEA
jgi:hypothetical protein